MLFLMLYIADVDPNIILCASERQYCISDAHGMIMESTPAIYNMRNNVQYNAYYEKAQLLIK
jgi:hypothetical protein